MRLATSGRAASRRLEMAGGLRDAARSVTPTATRTAARIAESGRSRGESTAETQRELEAFQTRSDTGRQPAIPGAGFIEPIEATPTDRCQTSWTRSPISWFPPDGSGRRLDCGRPLERSNSARRAVLKRRAAQSRPRCRRAAARPTTCRLARGPNVRPAQLRPERAPWRSRRRRRSRRSRSPPVAAGSPRRPPPGHLEVPRASPPREAQQGRCRGAP
jgi:hypothetical protein